VNGTVRVFNEQSYSQVFMYGSKDLTLPSHIWASVPIEFAISALANKPGLRIEWATDAPWDGEAKQLPGLLVCGGADRVYGWSVATERFMHTLAREAPFSLSYMPLGRFNAKYNEASPIVRAMVRKAEKQGWKPHEWALVFSLPYILRQIPAKRRILFTMWEAEDFPGLDRGEPWDQIVNTYAETVIVPSESQKSMWLSNGVSVPISVCPLGVDTETWAYHERVRSDDDPFTILLYGVLTARKSPLETATEVCYKAFRDVEDWKLILKTRDNALGAGAFLNPADVVVDDHIEVINETYTLKQMVELCHRADAGVFYSKYEGYGLPPLEMMSTGLPVHMTNYSGLRDNCNPDLNVPIPVTKVFSIRMGGYQGLSGWGMPDWDYAARKIREEYEAWHARKKAQSPMGRRAARWVRQNRTWEQATEKLTALLLGATSP